MTTQEIKEKVQALSANIEKQQQELFEVAKGNFNVLAMEIFGKHPDVKSFAWTQYTPYFMDGEPCTFGVNYDTPDINGYSEWRDEGEGKGVNFYENCRETKWNGNKNLPNPDYNPYHKQVIDEIEEFVIAFGDDVLQRMFGEGKVVVTPGHVEVEDYEHD